MLFFKLFIVIEIKLASYIIKNQINRKLFNAKIIIFERFMLISIFLI